MDIWSSSNESNLSGAVKSVRVEEQIIEFEDDFINEHNKPLLKERFEFDRQGRKFEHYLYTINGPESPKRVYEYNEKNWLIKVNIFFSTMGNKPFFQTRYTYDDFGNIKEITHHSIEGNRLSAKWIFKNDLQKKYFEYVEVNSKNNQILQIGFKRDEKCRIAEISIFQPNDKLKVKSVITFDKNDIPISTVSYSSENTVINKKKYEYEFDNQGNWTKKSHYSWEEKAGKFDWKLTRIEYRKINYYDSK